MSSLRSRVLRALPPQLRAPLRAGRGRLQRIEVRIRRRLPAGLGGSLRGAVTDHVLGPGDVDDYIAVRHADRSQRDRLRQNLAAADRFCVGLRYGPRLVAVGWCSPPSGIPDGDGMWLVSDYVDLAYRRRGLATELHRLRLRLAQQRGFERLYAQVDGGNRAALSAMRTAGFVEVERPHWRRVLRDRAEHSGLRDRDPRILMCETRPV